MAKLCNLNTNMCFVLTAAIQWMFTQSAKATSHQHKPTPSFYTEQQTTIMCRNVWVSHITGC